MFVGDPRQFVQTAARQLPQAMEMRFQPPKILRLQIQPQQIAQAPVNSVKILPRAIRCDVIGAAGFGLGVDERCVKGRRVHV
jgi:hypothetical protein